ncbi:MAG: hypothetical protein OEY56_04020 [Cyclobacteriaceae bacterium]|nr:hypothetical protein [Cyclobacteriaceae bacterium]
MKITAATYILLVFLALSNTLHAQNPIANLDMSGDIHTWYDQQMGTEKSSLILGTYQDVRLLSIDSHPFFFQFQWLTGSIRYRGQSYTNIDMMYNVFENFVIIRNPNYSRGNQPIHLNQSQVEWFELNGSFFRNYNENEATLPNGVYEELFIGDHVALIAKRSKKTTNSNNQSTITFLENDKYYFKYNGTYTRIAGRGPIIRQLKEKRKELRVFARDNELILQAGVRDRDLIMFIAYTEKILSEQ